jgi:hypothetical protein
VEADSPGAAPSDPRGGGAVREEARAGGREDGQAARADDGQATRQSPARVAEASVALRGEAGGIRTHDHRDHNPGLYQLSYDLRGETEFSGCYGAPERL